MLLTMPTAAHGQFRLITLDPGHFHASLVQKFMYDGVDSVVHVYAPAGDDVVEHLKRITAFNTRADTPTHWKEETYAGPDYLERMLKDRAGNVVVIAGNNARKAEYIAKSIDAGFNVLADKPMARVPADLATLRSAFENARKRGVLLYDVMTERYEVTTALQRELSQDRDLFGVLVKGSPDDPAITKESVHHFSKLVAGAPLKRPPWFFDVRQEGEGIVDVTTHLVDLIQWEAFPGVTLTPADVHMLRATRSATSISPSQFKSVTGLPEFPAYLANDVKDGALQVYSNGAFTYTLRGVHARISVTWNFEAPPGTGDTHFSSMHGTRARLVIKQGAEQKYKPVLYVVPDASISRQEYGKSIKRGIQELSKRFPGLSAVDEADGATRIIIPEKYDVGHEAHFAQVTQNFLGYLKNGALPEWEVPNMLVKYHTIMQAYEMTHARAEWDRTSTSIAWRQNGHDVWRFSFDPKFGKPFFHPLAVGDGPSFTNFKPEDHPWHYAHWFSWKYINHVNYWEEDRTSGQAAGKTAWSTPGITTNADGSATIRMQVTYARVTGEVDMTEDRTIIVSAPAADGSYYIDWSLDFTAGKDGAALDRTPMPGEPNGAVNGGYAGLSIRLAAAPMMMSVMTAVGPVNSYASDRARPNAPAVAGNFTQDGKDLGGIAVLSHPGNTPDTTATWYIINVPTDFRFIDASILAPAAKPLGPGEKLTLSYRVAVKGSAWSQSDLIAALNSWH